MSTPPFKFVVSPPTDSDPPSAALYTVDNLTGIEPPQIPSPMWATPYDYGAVGDGVADDTAAMQRWLDAIAGAVGYGKTGTFMASQTLIIKSNTTIFGAGVGNFVIMTQPLVPQNFQLLQNEHAISDRGPRQDRNIAIYNTTFQGDALTTVTGSISLIAFAGVDNLTIQNCRLWKRKQSTLMVMNCSNVRIDSNECTEWGQLTYATPGDGGYSGGTAIFVQSASDNVWVTNNYIHKGAGGIWLPFALPTESLNCVCTGNIIDDVLEFGITSPAERCVISDNVIVNVKRVDVSGHGMELFGVNYTVTNNVIDLCAGACIYLFDPVGVVVSHNVLQRSNQAMSPTGGSITINATSHADAPLFIPAGTYPPSFLTITNNDIFNSDSKGSSAIAFYRPSVDQTFLPNNILVANNNLGPNFWTTGRPIDFLIGVASVNESFLRGANFMIRDNQGAGQNDWSTNTVTFIIPSGSTGTIHVGAVGFRATWIQFQGVIPGTGVSFSSLGQNSWLTGWDVTGQVVNVAKSFGASSGTSWSINGTDSNAFDWAGRHSISLVDENGFPICCAGLIALDDDGFDLLILESVFLVSATGGADYVVGDSGTVDGGDGLLTYTVLTVDGGGAITSFTWSGGSGYVTGDDATTTGTTGIGTGFTVDIHSGSPTTLDAYITAVCHA